MRKLLSFLAIFLTFDVHAQSGPATATVHGADGGIKYWMTFSYDQPGDPAAVELHDSENTWREEYLDFVQMPGWFRNPHPLFPEFVARTRITLAKNDLGGSIVATPAIADGRLYFRTRDALICVGK